MENRPIEIVIYGVPYSIGEGGYLTIPQYAKKYLRSVSAVYQWIDRDIIRGGDILELPELNGLRLIRDKVYIVGKYVKKEGAKPLFDADFATEFDEAIRMILHERQEQIEKFGYTKEHALEHLEWYSENQLIKVGDFCSDPAVCAYPGGWQLAFYNKIVNEKTLTERLIYAGAFYLAQEEIFGKTKVTRSKLRGAVVRLQMALNQVDWS